MSGMEKFLNVLGFQVEYDEDNPEEAEQTVHAEEKRTRMPKRTESAMVQEPKQNNCGASAHVVLLEPEKISDAQKICNELKSGKTVVINTEKLSKEDMTRVLDFASGATYALNGSMREISDRVHVLAPYNVDIQTEELKTSYLDEDDLDEFDF